MRPSVRRARSSPTISPREFSTGTSARSPASKPSWRGTPRARYASGRCAPSSTLSAMPRPSACGAEKPLRAALRHPAVAEPHELGVGRAASADQLGVRAHRVRGPQRRRRATRVARTHAPSARGSAHRSRRRSRRPPSASTRARPRRRRDLREHRLLAGMRGEPVPLGRPVVRAAEQQHGRVLARAVVLEPGGLGAALEVVLGRAGLREEALHGLELIGRDGDATRRRSRSRRRRGRAVRGRPAAPGSASPSCGST